MSPVANTNAEVIAEFRARGGEVAALYDDPPPMLLLHTIGARSGREHIVPMRCLPDGDVLYVFGSAHGSDRHPDWYYNVLAHPDFEIEQGTETIPIHATELHGAEREAIFARHAARFPVFADYEAKLARTIPVFRLDRRNAKERMTISDQNGDADVTDTADEKTTDEQAVNARVIQQFRENSGKVGGQFAGANLVILHTLGAKTGQERLTPLVYQNHDDRFYVFAAGPGSAHHPAWYRNLVARPEVILEIGTDTFAADARVLVGDDRARIWRNFVAEIPDLPGWQHAAQREFPLIEFTRKS